MALPEAEERISTECLHQALHRAKPQLEIEIAVNTDSVFRLPAIVCDQISALRVGKLDIRIV